MIMKKKCTLILCILLAAFGYAQTQYYDAAQFPLLGKITDSTQTRYERLPSYLESVCRARLWQLGKNTSGLALRFRSNSTQISAKWNLLEDVSMNHMTATGIKGLDLYAWNGKKWQFVNTARPTAKNNKQVIIANMLPEEREYLLYLPLYDGVTDISIGIDSCAFIDVPKLPYPATKNPIICYGTSVTQGGCATRAGMSYTNIIERRLNHKIINLGFSGNGQLDYEIAELMSRRIDAGLFVLDFIPNVNLQQVKDKTTIFVKKLRAHNKEIPILLVESIPFPYSKFDKHAYKIVADKNRALRLEYEKFKQKGYKNIYYLSGEKLIGEDNEATVDGAHLTDLGFIRFANKLEKKILKIIGCPNGFGKQ